MSPLFLTASGRVARHGAPGRLMMPPMSNVLRLGLILDSYGGSSPKLTALSSGSKLQLGRNRRALRLQAEIPQRGRRHDAAPRARCPAAGHVARRSTVVQL